MPLSSNGYSPHWCLVLSGGNSWQEPNKPRHTTSPHGGLLVTGSWSGHTQGHQSHDTRPWHLVTGYLPSWHIFLMTSFLSHGLSSISWLLTCNERSWPRHHTRTHMDGTLSPWHSSSTPENLRHKISHDREPTSWSHLLLILISWSNRSFVSWGKWIN